jgi:HAD superfamily hydrolase (TIGR01509 family)
MKSFRAVAWDLDGTLIDSERLHQRALVEACSVFGVDLKGIADDAFRGVAIFDVWNELQPRFPHGLERQAWLVTIEQYYIERVVELTPIPGAMEVIRILASRGIAQACVSNSSRAIVDANLDALGIGRQIAFSISLDDVSVGKPDPEPFRLAMRRFALPAKAIVAVEDSLAGARSARKAGLSVVGYAPEGGAFGECDEVIVRLSELLKLFDA